MKHENNYDGKTDRPCIRQTPAVSLLALRSKLLILNAAREDSLRSEEHTSELQSQSNLVCRLLLEKKKLNDYLSVRFRSRSLQAHRPRPIIINLPTPPHIITLYWPYVVTQAIYKYWRQHP